MLLQSSTDSKHYHVVLSPDPRKNPEQPIDPTQIVVGETKDHVHIAEFSPETQSWFLLPANGHTHTITINDEYLNAPLKDEDEDTTIGNFQSRFKRALGYEKASIRKANKAYKYINQDQWDKSISERLTNDGRPALQFDQIGPNTEKIIGYFLQDIPDVAVYPIEKGDEVVADILTTVIKHILRNSGYEELGEGVFSDTFIAGKGLFSIAMDFTRDIGGDIVVEHGEYNQVIFGPHQKKDAKDCEDIFKIRVLSEDQLRMEFPDEADSVIEEARFRDGNVVKGAIDAEDYDMWLKTPGQQWDEPAAKPVPSSRKADEPGKLQNFVIVEWYRKSYFKEYIVRGPEGIEPPVRFSRGDQRQLSKVGVPMVDRISFVFEKVVVCNDNVMEKFDTGFDFAPFSVSYGRKTKNGFLGKVHGAIDQQDEINKRSSQMTDVINKMASYNWFYTGETFGSPEEEQDFLDNSAKPGSAYKIADMENMPQRGEGTKVPVEIIQLEENAIKRMDMYFGGILNLNETNKVGSRGLLLQQRTALMVNEIYFRHYENAFKDLCKKLVRFIQRFYPPQKILRIIRSAPTNEQEMAYQQMEDNAILQLLSTTDLTYFDTAFGVAKSSPTFKEAQFELASEMMRQGAGFPMDHWIDLSSFPNKQKIKDSIAAQSQAAMEQQNRTTQMEVVKSLPENLQNAVAPILLQQIGLLPQQPLPQQAPADTKSLGAPLQ